jgi:hypothetical protein
VHEGEALALAAIGAEGRSLPEGSAADALTVVRDRAAPEIGLDDFILGIVSDGDFRRRVTAALAEDAGPADFSFSPVVP